ncbi:MAG: hypothetical protein ACQEWG_06415 [Bacteroidota bacterium]
MKSKSISRTLFLFIIYSVAYPAVAQMDPIKKITIIIDPGHGGKDSSATGYYDLKEKDTSTSSSLQYWITPLMVNTIKALDKE